MRKTKPRNGFESIKVVGFAFLASLIVAAVFLLTQQGADTDNTPVPTPKPTDTSKQKSVEEVGKEPRKVTKTAEDDKKEAVKALTAILKEAGVSPTGVTPDKRVLAIDDGDTTVVSKKLKDSLHFSSEAPENFKNAAYQSLITLNTVVTTKLNKKEPVPFSEDSYNEVYLDAPLGTAFIPLSVYTSSGVSFSFEMVYVDGEWKLAPYSLVDAVKLSSILTSE